MSRENLNDDISRTDTGCESHDTPGQKPSIQPESKSGNSARRSQSFASKIDKHLTSQPKPRVMGRREHSISPERKPIATISAPLPLKSAMRQPRQEDILESKAHYVYRSSSLPRDSKVEFHKGHGEPKKQVKTVRYNETVKAAQIAQDLPPNVSGAQAEEILLPAKREAPIGGHDERYSESRRPPAPPYQRSMLCNSRENDKSPSTDLRDNIVNARRELLARNKPEIARPNKNIVCSQDPPKYKANPTPIQSLTSPNNSDGFYSSRDSIRMEHTKHSAPVPFSHRSPVPFSHYTNSNTPPFNDPHSRVNRHFSTSSLPRPPRKDASPQQLSNSALGRAPLPSYDEILSNRQKRPPLPQQPRKAPLNQASQNSITTNSAHTSNTQSFYTANHSTVTEEAPLTNTGSCSSSNPDSGYSGNFYESNTNGAPSSPAHYNSWYQQNLQSTALKMTTQQQALHDNRALSGRYPVQQYPPASPLSPGYQAMPPVYRYNSKNSNNPQPQQQSNISQYAMCSNMISDV